MGRKFIWKRLLPAVLLAAALYLVLGAVLPFARCPAVTEETRSAAAGLEVSGGGGERVRVVADSGEALRERVRLISQAEERLILSTFDIRADDSGKDVLCALLAAADRGVEVKMLVDGFCGLTRMAGNEYFIALSAHENAEVRIYNPIRPWIPWTLMARLHDKYLIADDAAYLLGGRNTHDAFLGDREGNHDWDVLVWREEPTPGDSLDQLLDYFGRVWSSPDCRVFHDDTRELGKRRVMAAGAALRERYVGLHNVHPDWLEPVDYGTATLPTEGIRLITNPIHTGPKEPTAFYAITELMGRGSGR